MWFQVIVLAIRNHRIVMTQVHSILIAVSSELPAWWCFSLQKISEYAFFFFFPLCKDSSGYDPRTGQCSFRAT